MNKKRSGITLFAGQCEAPLGDPPRSLRILFSLTLLLLVLTFTAGVARAQSGGELTGTVTDASGAVVPGANVAVTSVETGQQHTGISNGAGVFDFPSLNVGDYNLAVGAPGFESYKQNGVEINVAATIKIDVHLTVGANSQTVTVQANALQVQSETNEVSTLITGQQISQLATNGRNVTALTTLGTGVSSNLPSFNGVTAQGSDANISFNGLRPDHNNWLIDGGEVYDRGSGGKLDVMPSPDVLAQFQVLSSNYAPDYGINSGGTVTMELKSGTRNFHGALWEFVRNDALDAGYYFYKQNNTPTPELRLNIFGGDIGGPVWIPHVYNESKQKTFFFWAEEWRKYIQGANANVQNTVPVNDFPAAGAALAYTPFNNANAPVVPKTQDPAKLALYAADGLTPGLPFPGGVIPANLLDANAVLMMNTGAIPKPNVGTDQFISSPKQPTYVREDTVRADHNISDKLHLMGSYIHDSMQQVIYPPLWGSGTYTTVGNTFDNPSWATVIKLSDTISPTLLNEICLCVNGNTINTTPQGIYSEPSGWTAGSFFPGANALNRLPQVAFQGGPITTTWGTNYWPWKNSYLNYQLRDDLSWTKGRHSMKFGFSYMRADKNQQLQADTQGDYTFSNTQASGDAYVNFLLGFASTYQQLQDQRTDHWINNTYSGYAMDNWRVKPKLTLNIGVRYDALPHVHEKNNQVANFVPSLFNPADAQSPSTMDGTLNPAGPGFSSPFGTPFYLNGIGLAGVNGFPASLVKNDFGTWQPRVGFAYDVNGDGKTVFRGGFGLFFERVQGNDIYDLDTTPPYAYQPSANLVYFSNPSTSNQTGATAALPTGPANLSALNYYYPNPATYQFSLGLQKELAPSMVWAMQYVGSVSSHQDDRVEQNDLALGDIAGREAVATGGANANLARPYQGFGNILQSQNSVNGSYHSLQTALRMQERHGLSLQVAYTWSHAIDVQSNDLDTASNPYNLNYDRGSSLYDRRNIFNVNYVYDLPFFLHSGNFAERTLLGGWQIAGVTVAESGSPLQVRYNGKDTLGLGGNTSNYPDVVAHVTYPKQQKQWFNTAAFAAPATPWADPTNPNSGFGTGFGDGNKDAAIGPGLFNWNISLYKNIPIYEAVHMQFRAESFNTFNHTEFNAVDSGTGDANFGQVTSTYDPREFQLGLKLLF